MSLLANIDHLAIASGIEAVIVDAGTREQRGQQSWFLVLEGALDLFHRTDEKSIRLVVGKHTIVVQKEGEETVAVVLPTGHAIAKSLRRMIRRMARKDRGPLPRAKLAAAGLIPPQPQPTTVAPPAPPPTSLPTPSDTTAAPADDVSAPTTPADLDAKPLV